MAGHAIRTPPPDDNTIPVELPWSDEPVLLHPTAIEYRAEGMTSYDRVVSMWIPKALDVQFWQHRVNLAAQGDPESIRDVAVYIYDRVRTQKHFTFLRVYWIDFLRDRDWQVGLDPIPALEWIGANTPHRSLCTHLSNLHFSTSDLPPIQAFVQAASALESAAAEIVSIEHKLLDERGLKEMFGPGDKPYPDFQNRLRSRLGTVHRRWAKQGIDELAVAYEAKIRYVEATSRFYESVLEQISESFTTLGRRIFRFNHISKGRQYDGRTIAIPAVHSDALRSAFEFFGGLGKKIPQSEALIVGDLIAVLAGDDPTKEELQPAIHRAIGFCEAYPLWVRNRRKRDSEDKRRNRT